jgi:hypothetical protein
MIGFRRNDDDRIIAAFSDMTGRCDPGNSISDDDYIAHLYFIWAIEYDFNLRI